ncbi:pyrimidine-nucleoside phosphorylase [Propionigenium maris DSM 9537]|uniref:Pyrimidine-nucleoside phosphorylase n=1 Tax=Propionigenium maris DSM 9537 TaxID=1123000 RepID=A0A9W6GHZ8_9FUSO|nr:thymidine phosphorylase [Propionigenium maris]GLI55554.1 pyrimidine-nucleoside phosphorylase [Propionigenium maris DSM 9537]
MRAVDLIQKKRDGKTLTEEEINFLLDGYLDKSIPDYQMSAFLMATYFNGMEKDELKTFTGKMMNSGDLIKFDGIDKFLIDKHSTGGVGDKTTIALAGLFASFDIGTAKLSGRGLGHTGGTIDKFESIKGFNFPQTKERMVEVINKTGTGIMGASDKVVPLDKQIYALRDVTGTVMSIPLIASSIMSKKLAVYADGIILDVKVGSGAFMKDLDMARDLAKTMLQIGDSFDRKVVTVLTDMDQPLGLAVGNSLEVIEAIETLKGNGPADFTELVETLVAVALQIKGDAATIEEGKAMVNEMIKSGKPVEMLKEFIGEYGGDPRLVDDYSLLPMAQNMIEFKAENSGYIGKIEAEEVGKSAMVLGAGRATKEDLINHGVGVVLTKKIGDRVEAGEVLAKIYFDEDINLESSIRLLDGAFEIVSDKVEDRNVILEVHSVNI